VSAARRTAVRARERTGRARRGARDTVANEVTCACSQSGAPQRQHRQRVPLRRSCALDSATVDEPVETRDRVTGEVAKLAVEPALHRRIEALLRAARDRRAEALLDESPDRDLRTHAAHLLAVGQREPGLDDTVVE
jgi:hypothetical protein